MKLLTVKGCNNILSCDQCQKEIQSLYGGHPESNGYLNRLEQKLITLDQSFIGDLLHLKSFESLSGRDNLYSIRRPESKGNPRVLFFSVIETNEEPLYILLAAFHEHKSADYRRWIDVAENRKKTALMLAKQLIEQQEV